MNSKYSLSLLLKLEGKKKSLYIYTLASKLPGISFQWRKATFDIGFYSRVHPTFKNYFVEVKDIPLLCPYEAFHDVHRIWQPAEEKAPGRPPEGGLQYPKGGCKKQGTESLGGT